MDPTTSLSKPRSQIQNSTLSEILKLCRKMSAARQVPELLEMVTQESARLLTAKDASILLYDPGKRQLCSQVTLDGENICLDARLGIAGEVFNRGVIINVQNAQQDSRFHSGIDRRTKKHTRSLLAIPLKTQAGEIIGVFSIMNKINGVFSRQDEETGTILAHQATLAIETAQMLHELKDQRQRLVNQNAQLLKDMEGQTFIRNIMGNSPRMQSIVRLIDQLQDSSVDVLITGENGTGKELVAKALHYNSSRTQQPLVVLNSAALPETLVESELFGHEKGAFTGAEYQHIGKFEQAHTGTLFLDEIGDLSLNSQAKILRVLQERVLVRIGGQTSVSIDVRILAATNKDLEKAIKEGTFREDLYYRLRIIPIHMPALREIAEDIPMLASFFLTKYCNEFEKDPKKFSSPAMNRLISHSWPGNVRQLENEIKRLVVTVRRTTLTVDDLEDSIRFGKHLHLTGALTHGQTIHAAVEDLERRMIQEALQFCHYNQVQSANLLGLSRQGLIKKVKRYGIGKI